METPSRRLSWLILAGILAAGIGVLSLSNNPPKNPVKFDDADKFEHALAFLSLSFALCRGIPRRVGLGIGLTFLYGMGIEFLQPVVAPERLFEVEDLLSNAVGAILGGALVRVLDL